MSLARHNIYEMADCFHRRDRQLLLAKVKNADMAGLVYMYLILIFFCQSMKNSGMFLSIPECRHVTLFFQKNNDKLSIVHFNQCL